MASDPSGILRFTGNLWRKLIAPPGLDCYLREEDGTIIKDEKGNPILTECAPVPRGSLSLSGILSSFRSKAYSGAVTFSGAVSSLVGSWQRSGSLSVTGALSRNIDIAKTVTGILSFAKELSGFIGVYEGLLTFSGTVARFLESSRTPSGSLAMSGTVTAAGQSYYTASVGGSLFLSGSGRGYHPRSVLIRPMPAMAPVLDQYGRFTTPWREWLEEVRTKVNG